MGGGCAPFAVALLKAGGRYDPALDAHWKRSLTISERLIGEPGKRKVPMPSLLLGRRWEQDGFVSRHLELYDPSMIWQFIVDSEKRFSPPKKSGATATEAIFEKVQMLPSGLIIRQGASIVLPMPEFIGHRRYPKRPGRKVVEGVVLEVKSEK